MPDVEANGQRLYYEEHGAGEPLLCVTGLGADARAWAPQVRSWSADYRTVIFDNRDVGRSSYVDAPYEVTDMAGDALALADALGLDSFHLVGMSLGGAIAQEMALSAPERVLTLTLIVSYAGTGGWGPERARLVSTAMSRMSPEERVDYMMMLCFSESFYADERRFGALRRILLANPDPQPPEAFARQIGASGRHEARDRVGELAMPVHVIGAGRDMLVPVWKSTELAELIPDAKLTIIEKSGHAVNIEAAEELSRVVLEFLSEAPARTAA